MFAGYDILQVLHDTERVQVLRCRRHSDGLPVIVKSAHRPHTEHRRFREEYRVLQALAQAKVAAVPVPLELLQREGALAIVTRDGGGHALRAQLSPTPLALGVALRVGVQVCAALVDIHRARVVHRDINPSNLVLNPQRGTVEVIDFGIASHAAQGARAHSAPEGTLAYLAPEQTGQVDLPGTDARSDLYALGATLYELFTGQPPFAHASATAQLHAILATRPTAPQELVPTLPTALGQVIMRLLEKQPGARYQSARGLLHDLQVCSQAWEREGRIPPFTLGARDASERLELPRALFGRAGELAQLAQAHAGTAQGQHARVLLSGPSGIGKTALVQEALHLIAERRGLFIAGKHEALRHHEPFVALRQALAALAQRLLGDKAAFWGPRNQRLRDAVGPAGQALIDLCPHLQHLLGPQPPLATLPPLAQEQRLLYALRRLFAALCATQPLVVFLDDLQWADSGTLRLLERLEAGPAEGVYGLLLIGAFREQGPAHPLTRWLERLEASDAPPTRLTVAPLAETHVTALLAAATEAPGARVATPLLASLARWVHAKTQGNPLFVRECLADLHARGLLTPGPDGWRWDLRRITATTLAADLVSLLRDKLRAAPAEAQLLGRAACLGLQFGAEDLAALCERPQTELAAPLRQAIDTGWLQAQEGSPPQYVFTHDRMHQAAYSLLSPDEAVLTHHRISQRMLGQLGGPGPEQRLFETLKHLNAAQVLIAEPQTRAQLAELNGRAGAAARGTGAHDLAERYTAQALQLLPADAWRTQYPAIRAIQLQLADCEFLTGKTEAARERLDAVALRSRGGSELAEVYERRAQCQTALSDYPGAVRYATRALGALGFRFHATPSAAQLAWAQLRLHISLRAPDRAQRPAPSPRVLHILRILDALCVPAYFTEARLYAYLAFTLGWVTARHRASQHSAFTFATLCSVYAAMHRPRAAVRFAARAHALLHGDGDAPFTARRARIATLVSIDYAHLPAPQLADACHACAVDCLENGDLNLAANSSMVGLDAAALHKLDLAQTRLRRYQRLAAVGNRELPGWYRMHVQLQRLLTGQTLSPTSFSDARFDEAAHLAALKAEQVGLATFHFFKLIGLCAHAEWGLALQHGAAGLQHGILVRHGEQVAFYFGSLYALALSQEALAAGRPPRDAGFLRRMLRKQAGIARAQPGLATGMWLLSRAEACARRGWADAAARLYAAALPWLVQSEYTAFVALATECYARHRARQGRAAQATALWKQALAAHQAWGTSHRASVLDARLSAGQGTRRATQRLHQAFTGMSTQRIKP